MKKRTLGLMLMLAAIGIMGFQIGATAKHQETTYFFLIPIGLACLVVGLPLWYSDISKTKK
ncbi:MAG: hypothetical protein AAF840_05180 [Bacteroidota bacterium]